MEETGRQRGQTMTGHERRAPGQHGVNDTLVGLGLASVGSDRVVRWNDKGRAIAAATHVNKSTALAREVAAMSLEFEDDLEEVGLWQRNAR